MEWNIPQILHTWWFYTKMYRKWRSLFTKRTRFRIFYNIASEASYIYHNFESVTFLLISNIVRYSEREKYCPLFVLEFIS